MMIFPRWLRVSRNLRPPRVESHCETDETPI